MMMSLKSLLLPLLLGRNHLWPTAAGLVTGIAQDANDNCSTITEIACQTEGFGASNGRCIDMMGGGSLCTFPDVHPYFC
jgi:hypothetical protein